MNYVFYIIGAIVLVNAFLSSSQAQSSIHQIYFQLQYLTAIFLIGFGHLFTCINNQKREKQNNLPSDEERRAFEKQQIENMKK